MTMRTPPTYMGIPLGLATQERARHAIMMGKLIERRDGFVFYQLGRELYVLPIEDAP